MSVKAKFKVDSITEYQDAKEVNLSPVIGAPEDNKAWSQATPSGRLIMHVTNPAAYNQFQVGKEYFLTVEPVE